MRIEYTSQPLTEPVLLNSVKDALNVSYDDKDAFIGSLISSARQAVENYTDLCLVNRSADIYLNGWPKENADSWWSGVRGGSIDSLIGSASEVKFTVRPIQSVSGIVTIDANGIEAEWGATNYYLQPGLNARLFRNSGTSWPVPGRVADGIKISVTAGFGPDWNHIPADLRAAINKIVAHMFVNRGDEGGSALVDSGATKLLNPYRNQRL